MESEPKRDGFRISIESDPSMLPAYMERWDGKRMIRNNYVDLFEAEHDPFIDGLRSEDGESQVGRRSPLVSPLPGEENTGEGLSDPPVGKP